MKKNKQGTWWDVVKELLVVVLLMCTLRWVVAEPFLVPSGSMIPTLLIKDYIFVTKFPYGLRLPFTKMWIFGPVTPKRGDVVVFRSKDDDFYFMVKRVVGLPGDRIRLITKEGVDALSINGELVNYQPLSADASSANQVKEDFTYKDDDFHWFKENLPGKSHNIQHSTMNTENEESQEYIVPKGHIFMMGDNRDRSSDSRTWGPLPLENILGKAQFIWMSCAEDSPAGGVLCFGEDLRAGRLFKAIE